ncbi:MAG: hypothetical protein LBN98_04835 [Prevotellaceae bacterium]|jgi:hypothetical protein|nr:hypothetical protein [Prevotellaceae bacterium]
MENLITIAISLVNTIFDQVNLFFNFLLPTAGGLSVAFALGAVASGDIMEGLLAGARRWHGGINDQFAAIDNLVNTILSHPEWPYPADFGQVASNRDQLLILINRCHTNQASLTDRAQRNMLLKSTVGLCLLQVKVWAYASYTNNTITANDVHLLGFLLPGETGGHHDRTKATNITAEVKVKILDEDHIRVVIDQSVDENAALVAHGWPPGVKNAMIVILASDGKTEVYRQITTRLHNDIQMPEGSRGKQFIIKAAFLKHVDDDPIFGAEPTFFMPLNTEDLAAALDRQHHEEFEEQIREVERQRQEIERLRAELRKQ